MNFAPIERCNRSPTRRPKARGLTPKEGYATEVNNVRTRKRKIEPGNTKSNQETQNRTRKRKIEAPVGSGFTPDLLVQHHSHKATEPLVQIEEGTAASAN